MDFNVSQYYIIPVTTKLHPIQFQYKTHGQSVMRVTIHKYLECHSRFKIKLERTIKKINAKATKSLGHVK